MINCHKPPQWLKYTNDIKLFSLNQSILQVTREDTTGDFLLLAKDKLIRISNSNIITTNEPKSVINLLTNDQYRLNTLFNGDSSFLTCRSTGKCSLIDLKSNETFKLVSNVTYVPRTKKILSSTFKVSNKLQVYVVAYENNHIDQLDIVRHESITSKFHVLPMISFFVKNDSKLKFLYDQELMLNLRLDQLPKIKIQFVHTFQYENYIYFVTNQVNHEESHNFYARIGRFNLKTNNINKIYQEVSVSCDNRNVDKNFTIATSATLSDRPSDYFADGKVLFITFARRESMPPHFNPTKKSDGAIVCAVSMDFLSHSFEGLSESCVPPGQLLKVDVFRTSNEIRFARYLKSGNCYHGDILVTQVTPLNMRMVLRSTSSAITSMIIYSQNGNAIGIFGNSKGGILKGLVNGVNSSIFIFNRKFISDSLVNNGKDLPIYRHKYKVLSNPIIVDKFVYLTMDSLMVKFPLESCGIHTCRDCQRVFDPLGCSWCNTKCVPYGQCDSKYNSHDECEPIVYEVTPSTGPITGGTVISLKGENFGGFSHRHIETDRYVSMKYPTTNWDRCNIKHWSNHLIAFETNPANNTIESYSIRVERSNKYLFRNFTIEKSFKYVKPTIETVTPSSGHIFGGSLMIIQGNHLDSGSSKEVKLGSSKCKIIKFNSTTITCLTQPIFDLSLGHSNSNEKINQTNELTNQIVPIKVIIDSLIIENNLTFEYKVDPVIKSYSPYEMAIGFLTPIKLNGINFDLIENPLLVFQYIKFNTKLVECPCLVINQSTISCELSEQYKFTPGNYPFALTFDDNGSYVVKTQIPLQIQFRKKPLVKTYDELILLDINNPILTVHGNNLHGHYSFIIGGYTERSRYHVKCPIIKRNHTNIECKLNINYTLNQIIRSNDIFSMYYSIGRTVVPLVRVGFINNGTNTDSKTQETNSGSSFDRQYHNLLWFFIIPLIIIACFASILVTTYLVHRRSPTCINLLQKLGFSSIDKIEETNSSEIGSKKYYSGTCTAVISTNCTVDLDPSLITELDSANKLIDSGLLIKGELIGKGHFGHVYFGCYNKTDCDKLDVAIKTIQHANTSIEITSFFREADIMKDFDHPNVMSLLGFVLPEVAKTGECQPAIIIEPPMIVLPFMWNGDLLTYVRDEKKDLRLRELVKFTMDIATGMSYLSERKFIHRDLAARNCMLDENLIVKVSDFGLSRNTQHGYYYSNSNINTPLPFKWMSPESLQSSTFTTKSDVWSYGVTCWEILTRGHVPYLGIESYELESLLIQGYRLNQPTFCPDYLYFLWNECWSLDPINRPNFPEIVNQIKLYIDQKDSSDCFSSNVTANVINRNLTQGLYYNDVASGSS